MQEIRFKKTIWFPVILFLLCLFCTIEGLGAEKPAYLRSVTYFGEEWPINFWNSEDEHMEENFTKIAADGYNSIILVVPWREFQPQMNPVSYNSTAMEHLKEIMECAGRHGLYVTLRVGYSWDYAGTENVQERYHQLLMKDSPERKAWIDYCRTLYETVSVYPNFYGGFLTWEDLWDARYTISRGLRREERLQKAKEWGYQDYLREHYTLEQVDRYYGGRYDSMDDIMLPLEGHPASVLFFEFYDEFLMDLLRESQTVFPELSLEVRVDGEPIFDQEGNKSYYSHSGTYQAAGAPYTALMYSVALGQTNNYERLPAAVALDSMQRQLSGICENAGRKKLYVEQLLYMDSTEEFSYNAQVMEEQLGDYVRNLAPVLSQTTMGFGLWVYRDYVNNAVYNSGFGQGTGGWNATGQVKTGMRNGSHMAVLSEGTELSQNVTGRLGKKDQIFLELHLESDGPSRIRVEIGDLEKEIDGNGERELAFTIPWTSYQKLSITGISGTTYVDDVRVYTYTQNGRIYDRSGNALDLRDSFRSLNATLSVMYEVSPKEQPET